MRFRMAVGGATVMVVTALGLFAPIYYDGHSVAYWGEQCLTLQGIEGFMELVIFPGDTDQCQTIRQIALGIYGFGAAGLIVLAVGLLARR